MSGKDAIIEKILSESRAQADKIINDAKAKASSIVKEARDAADNMQISEVKKAADSAPDIEKRKITVANLEVRKIQLKAKQQVINDAFSEAEKSLSSLPKEKYKALLFSMLKAEASDGDIITAAEKDKDIVTKAFIAEASKKLNKNLKLSDSYGTFSGGLMISGSNYDKNLTFSVELKTLREENEPEIAKMIFGEIK